MNPIISSELTLFAQEIQRFLSSIVLKEIAKKVGFVQQSSKYQADELIALCVWFSQEGFINTLFNTADAMDKTLDRMENIKVTDKYKDIHELVLEGVTDARQGTKIIQDANKEDGKEIELAILKSTPHMSGVDSEQ